MIADLATLLDMTTAALWSGFVVFVRIAAMTGVLPAFGEQSIPVRVRFGLALAFTLVVAPAVAQSVPPFPSDILGAVPLIAMEIGAGLFFGMLLRLFVHGLQIAGSIAAQSTSLSQIFGGTAGVDPLPAMGHVLVVGGLALAAMAGLHVEAAAYMISSYQLVPVGVLISPDVTADLGVATVARVFTLGFTLAAPFVITSLIYNVTLGVINRAMPQLMVSFVGAPAITAGGLFLLLLTAPLILTLWVEALFGVLGNPAGAGG